MDNIQIDNLVESVIPTRRLTWKRLIVYTITFFWLFLLVKWSFKLLVKGLDKLREYIHNLTNKDKMAEVIFYTIVGIVIGVLLNKQILQLLEYLGKMINEVVIPWIRNLLRII